jgi:hypothetical protein
MATMRIERRSVKRKLAPPAFYYYLVTQDKGNRKRMYIRLRNVLGMMDMVERERRRTKMKESTAKAGSGPREKTFFQKTLRLVLESAGYSTYGSTLKRGKSYMSKQATGVRFAMLDRESQEMVGSPENLLKINGEANSLLKRRNRYGIKTNYNQCMQNVMEEKNVEEKEEK